MKVAVSAMSGSLDAQVAPNFGRCPYFVVVETETMDYEAIPNSGPSAAHGAGIQAARLVAGRGVRVVLTGNVGPNAFGALSSAGIEVVTGVSGSVREAVERYKRGELRGGVRGPTVGSHFGGGVGGRGRGRGWRRV